MTNCPVCNGNDANVPCAYPSGGQPGCLRDQRLAGIAEEMNLIIRMLNELYTPEEQVRFLGSPNSLLDNLTPLHLIVNGEAHRVREMLERVLACAYI